MLASVPSTPVVAPTIPEVATPAPSVPVVTPAITPVTPAPVVTEATIRAEHDRLLAELRANFTREKQLARIALRETTADLELQSKIDTLNASL